ncbi:MAG: amidase [Alphaproteobacteria bacterium]|jgi:aspartyl-tRNA(Asn)/glutamyl-tRNA(Gln) amidotransferase subunit A|nr:amidase [Alphaproteobacteria bacterium]MBT4018690.1 amidase [Alphaproteobacteria bacterium]MBT5158682.1 amidase [Alphaproteobacteria bacterium]MBT5920099.1 amidase [Alphaproteobacteria bacterium]MBT6386134.1 amidase [Alphaproteobacteria bacterium]
MTGTTTNLDTGEMMALYASGDLSPVTVAEDLFVSIEKQEPVLNAFQVLDQEAALSQARASEARWHRGKPMGDLDGVPVSIKELILTKGWPTRQGSLTTDADQAWDVDAPAVARLREAGAVLFGKTTSPEFGWKGITDSPLSGVTRNPWNPDYSPGGSSGGAGAAVAAGLGPLALGTDGGGSIRIPASYCGLFGIKPTFGRVPSWPQDSAYSTLVSSGPLSRNVADAARMLNVITRPDYRDWYALPPEKVDYLDQLSRRVKGLRIGYSPSLGGAKVTPEVAGIVAKAIDTFADLGAHVEIVDDIIEPLRPRFEDYWVAGFAAIYRNVPVGMRDHLDPGFRKLAERGLSVDLEGYYKGLAARVTLAEEFSRFYENHDLLMTPTMPSTAPKADVIYHSETFDRWNDAVPYTVPFNLTGLPAASVPAGLDSRQLPVGLQIVGPRFAEFRILAAAAAFEQVRPFPTLLKPGND